MSLTDKPLLCGLPSLAMTKYNMGIRLRFH